MENKNNIEKNMESVVIDSIEYDSKEGARHDWTNHRIHYPVIATASNGAVKKETFDVNAGGHYSQGYRDGLAKASEESVEPVTIVSVEYDSKEGASQNWTDHRILYPVVATASNGAEKKQLFDINAAGHYSQGYRDGLAKKREIVKVTKIENGVRIWWGAKEFTDCEISE